MSLQMLDLTQWSYPQALDHVQTVTVARGAAEAAERPPKRHYRTDIARR